MPGTIADWRAYALERGDLAPTHAIDFVASATLVRATDYIQFTYVQNFKDGYDDTLDVVEKAVYEAANLELKTPGLFSKTFTPSQQKVLTEAKGIKWTLVGDASGVDAARPVSTKIEAMLGLYVGGRATGIMVV